MRAPHPTPRDRAGRTRPTVALAPLAALTVTGLLLAGCSQEEEPTVTTRAVTRGDVQEVVDATGVVQPRASSTVSTPAGGTVATLLVTDGQEVTAGQVLATIDSPSARDNLAQAQQADAEAAESGGGGSSASSASQVARDQRRAKADATARFDEAQRQAETIADPAARQAALAAVQSSRTQYDLLAAQTDALVSQVNNGLGNLDSAVASLGQAQRLQTRAAVSAAQATVDALTVTAPIAGRVSLAATGGGSSSSLPAGAEGLLAQSGVSLPAGALGGGGAGPAGAPVLAQGAAVAAGSTLMTVIDASTLSLTADVDETDVLSIRPGTVADVTIEAVDGADYRGTVTSIDPTATTSGTDTVTYTVRLSYDGGKAADGQPAATPLPGMSTVVSLVVADAPGVVAVPAAAVVRAGADNGLAGADSVFVVRGGVAEQRKVTVGVRGEETVEITEGLSVGDDVVVEGAGDVTDGEKVA